MTSPNSRPHLLQSAEQAIDLLRRLDRGEVISVDRIEGLYEVSTPTARRYLKLARTQRTLVLDDRPRVEGESRQDRWKASDLAVQGPARAALTAPGDNPAGPEGVRALREALGLTQAGLANLLGCHAMTVSKLERGMAEPVPYMIQQLSLLSRGAAAMSKADLARFQHVFAMGLHVGALALVVNKGLEGWPGVGRG